MSRIGKIIIGVVLIAYGVYSTNQWFYFGYIPLMMGICDKCPFGGCKDGQCEVQSSSCSDEKPNIMNFSAVAPIETKIDCCGKDDIIFIKILGTGCSNCVTLYNTVNEAVKQINGKFEVSKVEDLEEIMKYSVISTPGLVINEVVKSTGKLLSIQEVIELINGSTKYMGNDIKIKCCGN